MRSTPARWKPTDSFSLGTPVTEEGTQLSDSAPASRAQPSDNVEPVPEPIESGDRQRVWTATGFGSVRVF